jgi:hypothetical protein
MAADVELQRRLDRSLRGAFVVPPFVGLPTNGHPTPLPRGQATTPAPGVAGPRAAAAAAAGIALSTATDAARRWSRDKLLLTGIGVAIAGSALWLAATFYFNHRVSFDEVYRDVVAAPPPASAAGGSSPFETACQKSLGQALQPRNVPTTGVQFLGVSEAPVLSRKTVVLRARVDNQDVLLFADRAGEDADALRRMTGSCHLHLFRRDAGGMVLYELTPLDKPRLLDHYAEPPPEVPGCGEHPASEG